MSFDEVLEEKIRPLGRWQILIALMVVVAGSVSPQMIPQLANLSPPFICSGSWFHGWTYDDVVNISTQITELQQQRFHVGNQTSSSPDLKCHRYDLSGVLTAQGNASIEEKKHDILAFVRASNVSLQSCSGPWLYDSKSAPYRYSLIEGFDMVCDRKVWIPYSAIVYTVGMGIGVSTGGQLADRYGRRVVFCIAYLLYGVFGVLVLFCKSVEFFLVLRFAMGIGHLMFFGSSYVYIIEHTNNKHRNTFTLIDGICDIAILRNIAFLVNYLIQDYRWVHFAYGAFMICFSLILVIFLDESPRWLIAKGRYAEALKIVRKGVLRNGASEEVANAITEQDLWLTSDDSDAKPPVAHGFCTHVLYALRDWMVFLTSAESFKRWAPLSVLWIVIGGVVYGISYYGVRLQGNPYLIAFCMSFTAFPSKILQWFLLDKLDRKKPLIGLFIAAFVFALTALIAKITNAPGIVTVVFATLVISCTGCLFGIVYLVTPELFPTLYRNKALGFLSAVCRFGVIGGMFVERLKGFWPLLCFSTALGVASLCSLLLPRGDYKIMTEGMSEKRPRSSGSKTNAEEEENEEEETKMMNDIEQ